MAQEPEKKDGVVAEGAPKAGDESNKPGAPTWSDYKGLSQKVTRLTETLRAKGYESVDDIPDAAEATRRAAPPKDGGRDTSAASGGGGYRVVREGRTGRPLPPMPGDFTNDSGEYDAEAHRAAQVKYEDEREAWSQGQRAEVDEDRLIARELAVDDEDVKAIKAAVGNDAAMRDLMHTLARGIAGGTATEEHVVAAKKRLKIMFETFAENRAVELLRKAKEARKTEPTDLNAPDGARSPNATGGEPAGDKPAAQVYQEAAEDLMGARQ